MKFYASKYKIVTLWEFKEGSNVAKESIPEGTIMMVSGMDNNGFCLAPVNKSVNTGMLMSFSPEMLKAGFTESDYLPD